MTSIQAQKKRGAGRPAVLFLGGPLIRGTPCMSTRVSASVCVSVIECVDRRVGVMVVRVDSRTGLGCGHRARARARGLLVGIWKLLGVSATKSVSGRKRMGLERKVRTSFQGVNWRILHSETTSPRRRRGVLRRTIMIIIIEFPQIMVIWKKKGPSSGGPYSDSLRRPFAARSTRKRSPSTGRVGGRPVDSLGANVYELNAPQRRAAEAVCADLLIELKRSPIHIARICQLSPESSQTLLIP